jgi:hypothetical protein
LRKIFGSNLFLKDKKIKFVPIKPYAELRSALKKFLKNEVSFSVVRSEGFELGRSETSLSPQFQRRQTQSSEHD